MRCQQILLRQHRLPQQPDELNLAGGCASISGGIRKYQKPGVKVKLSLAGGIGSYALASEADGRREKCLNNFLGGRSSLRPLGDAVLDGIDFDIEMGSTKHWDDVDNSKHLFCVRKVWKEGVFNVGPTVRFPFAFWGVPLVTWTVSVKARKIFFGSPEVGFSGKVLTGQIPPVIRKSK